MREGSKREVEMAERKGVERGGGYVRKGKDRGAWLCAG